MTKAQSLVLKKSIIYQPRYGTMPYHLYIYRKNEKRTTTTNIISLCRLSKCTQTYTHSLLGGLKGSAGHSAASDALHLLWSVLIRDQFIVLRLFLLMLALIMTSQICAAYTINSRAWHNSFRSKTIRGYSLTSVDDYWLK